MDYIFDDWKKVLDDFKSSVEKELKEIRKHKAEVQQIKAELSNELIRGRYIRDEQRIVLSAPEIIIGNVDKSGMLLNQGGSTLILRSNHIRQDAAGETGSVVTHAASIRQIAADPGMDGNEAVVGTLSEVVSQARNIVIQSNDNTDVFSVPTTNTEAGGVHIHADSKLTLEATQSSERKKQIIEDAIERLNQSKEALKSGVDKQKSTVEDAFKNMASMIDAVEELRETDEDVRSNILDIDDLNNQIRQLSPHLYNAVNDYIQTLSLLAENNRQLTALKKQKEAIVKGDDFKKKSTGASVIIRGEQIGLASIDGDGNLRDNEGAGIDILGNKVKIASLEYSGELKGNGEVLINAKSIALSTANKKYKDNTRNGDVTAEGDIVMTSKNVTLEAIDRELKDGELQEKELTKDGRLSIRMEKTDLSATDTEGKAIGSITVNSKTIEVKSMDVEKEKRTDDKLSAGSSMLLLSEKMYMGAKDKDNKSKKIQAVGEEVGLFADKTLEAQQGEAKAVVQLDGGNVSVSGSKTQIYGATTINAKTEVKDELKAPKATIDNLEAKTSFKSSNISDGIAVPAPAGAGSLSAKLKTEDAPKES